MPFAVEVLDGDRLLRARWFGVAQPNEARAALAAIRTEVKAHPVRGVLLDFRDVPFPLSPDEAVDVGIGFAGFLGRLRLAIVASSRAHHPFARLIAQQGQPGSIAVDVFRTEAEALQWLHSAADNAHGARRSTQSPDVDAGQGARPDRTS